LIGVAASIDDPHPDHRHPVGARLPPVVVTAIDVAPLSVPLRDPFVIASGRIDVTRAALVRATVQGDGGRRAVGLGEAAALPPVTREDQPELLAAIAGAARSFAGARLERFADLSALIDRLMPAGAVARAGVESAILDAWARAGGVPLRRALGDGESTSFITDITLPISDPDHMAALARGYRAAGFSCFKVKVGRDGHADRASLRAVAAAVPDARFRLDANAGFSARDALTLLDAVLADGLAIECYEQPCAADDLAGMAEVTARSAVPVVADESFRGPRDLDRIAQARAAHAVNLKLAKLGGPLAAMSLARQARAAGFRLMAGAMVETRVGLLAMAHVAAALGQVDWIDLDTAFLLAEDPFVGGWTVSGARIELTDQPGLGVEERAPAPEPR
jgi:L-alanine-DL-glutamate epimerase-like enolase superfamily enzyme